MLLRRAFQSWNIIPAWNLRNRCFFIAYVGLIGAILNVAWYVAIMWLTTKGFECDPSIEKINPKLIGNLDAWIPRLLQYTFIGTHGFFNKGPYMKLAAYNSEEPQKCYHGFIHITFSSFVMLLVHLVWCRLTYAFLEAIQKRTLWIINNFFRLCVIKLVVNVALFGCSTLSRQKNQYDEELTLEWKIMTGIDLLMSVYVVFIINRYYELISKANRPNGCSLRTWRDEALAAMARNAEHTLHIMRINHLNEPEYACK